MSSVMLKAPPLLRRSNVVCIAALIIKMLGNAFSLPFPFKIAFFIKQNVNQGFFKLLFVFM